MPAAIYRLFSIALLVCVNQAHATNLAGDANLDGAHTLSDAALIQAAIYGTAPPQTVSPLAHVDGDTSLSLADLKLVAQKASGVRTALIASPGILTLILPPTPILVASEELPHPLITFGVSVSGADATLVDGLELNGFSILEAAESMLANPDTVVAANAAGVELVPLNTTSTEDNLTIRLSLPLHDSEGTLVDMLSADASTTVTPATCGDGVVQGGENCDLPLPYNPTSIGFYDTPGNPHDVFVTSNRAYVADGTSGLQVLDISTPTPTYIGGYDTPDFAYEVFVTDNRAWVADGSSGLQVFDISTPTPTYIGSYDTPGIAEDVFVSGNRAYVADRHSGLQVLDISTPTPTYIGGYDTPGQAHAVFVTGNSAYVADGSSGLQVLDISTPSPTSIGSYDAPGPGSAQDVFVSGTRAYVVESFINTLQVLDISSPNPTFIGAYDLPSYAYGVFVSGKRAWVADDYSGLQVLDISTPNPAFVGAYDTPGVARGVFVSGTRAYVADGSSGLQVLDISEPCTAACTLGVCGDGIVTAGESCDGDHPLSSDSCRADCQLLEFCGNGVVESGESCDDGDVDPCTTACNFNCSSPANNICGDGIVECGELCDDGNTLACDGCAADCSYLDNICGDGIVECSETCDSGPFVPPVVGQYPVSPYQYLSSVAVRDNRAWIVDGNFPFTLLTLDISSDTPTLVTTYSAPPEAPIYADVLVLEGDLLYAVGDCEAAIFDVSEDTPQLRGVIHTQQYNTGLLAEGGRAFIAVDGLLGPGYGLVTVDSVSAPPAVVESSVISEKHIYALTSTHLYAGNYWESDFSVYDITSNMPVLLGSGPTSAQGISIVGNRAYVYGSGFHILDISTFPPTIISSLSLDIGSLLIGSSYYTSMMPTSQIVIKGNRAWIAAGDRGIWVVDITNDTPVIRTNFDPGGSARAIAVEGNRAYVAVSNNGLKVFDISETCGLDCTIGDCGDGIVQTSESCDDGNTLDGDGCRGDCTGIEYCGDGRVDAGEACDDGDTDPCTAACNLDCSGPTANVCGNGLVDCGEVCDDGNTAPCDGCSADCLAEEGCGDGIINCGEVSDPARPRSPVLLDQSATPSSAALNDIVLRGDRAYVTLETYGLLVFDISGITPSMVGSYPYDYLTEIVVYGGRAYVYQEAGYLLVFDISSDTPALIGAYPFPFISGYGDLTLDGDRLIVFGVSDISVFDISSGMPIYLSGISIAGFAYDLAANNNRIYLATEKELIVLDYSSGTPVEIWRMEFPQFTGAMAIQGDRLYMTEADRILFFDISNPAPVLLNGFRLELYMGNSYNEGLVVQGDRLYLSSHMDGLDIYDISSDSPSLIGRNTSVHMISLAARGDRAYGISGDSILTFDISESWNDQCHFGHCGDGAVGPGELCDDGNTTDCDGCAGDCSRLDAQCGDGVVECGETCDDGDNDSCTAACNAYCTGPSADICGDGLAECGEVCDDGNTADCDGCKGDCSRIDEICGDGIMECGEPCDDGNNDGGDGCAWDCSGP